VIHILQCIINLHAPMTKLFSNHSFLPLTKSAYTAT